MHRNCTVIATVIAKTIFGSSNDRYVAKLGKIVEAINAYEPTISALTDEELAGQTVLFRQRLADGAKLDDLLPEAFATVREAAKRTLGQRHYDVQMIGGIALHRGEIAEMRTGEGNTNSGDTTNSGTNSGDTTIPGTQYCNSGAIPGTQY